MKSNNKPMNMYCEHPMDFRLFPGLVRGSRNKEQVIIKCNSHKIQDKRNKE